MPHRTGADAEQVLTGKKTLVLEDDFLISEHLKLMLTEAGAAKVQVVHTLESFRSAIFATDSAPEESFHLAILDLKVGKEYVFDDLALLVERGIGFVFASGVRGSEDVPKQWRKVPLVQKPYLDSEVVNALKRVEDVAAKRPA